MLPYVMFPYRISAHESTGYTPHFLLFGHEVTLPVDAQFPAATEASWTSYYEQVAETQLRFHTACEQARQHMHGQQKRQHTLYNAKVHGPTYTEGQIVSPVSPQLPNDSVLHFILLGAIPTNS